MTFFGEWEVVAIIPKTEDPKDTKQPEETNVKLRNQQERSNENERIS